MKVKSWRNVEECAEKYIDNKSTATNRDVQDTFTAYNTSIKMLIKNVYGQMSKAYSEIGNVSSRLSATDAEIKKANEELVAARGKIQTIGQSKEQQLALLIEQKKSEAIEAASVLDAGKYKRLLDRKEELLKLKDATPTVDEEAIRRDVYSGHDSSAGVYEAARSVLDMYNRQYTEFSDKNSGQGWSRQFYAKYNKVHSEAKSNSDTMMRVAGGNYTSQKIMSEFNNSYKKSPYALIKILMWLFLLPIAAVKYKYQESSIPNCLSILFKDIAYGKDRIKRILTIVIWIMELSFLLKAGTLVKVAVVIVAVALIGGFILSKKKLDDQITKMVEIATYYETSVVDIEDEVKSRIAEAKAQRMEQINSEYNSVVEQMEKMSNEDIEARKKAYAEFDPSKIDKSDLEAQFASMIASMKSDIQAKEKRIEELKAQKDKIVSEQEVPINNYNKIKEEIKDRFLTTDENSSFSLDGAPFNFIISQADAQCILKNVEKPNCFGCPITLTGRIPRERRDILEFRSDMPPVSMPLALKPITKGEFKEYVFTYPWYDKVYEDILAILSEVDKEVRSEREASKVDISGYDFTKFYKFELAYYNLRNAVVFYNSKQDPDSVRTIMDMCVHNIILPVMNTTNTNGLSFQIITMDETTFQKINFNNSASVEQQNSMKSLKFYEVHAGSDKDQTVRDLCARGSKMLSEIGGSARNIVEYRAKKMNGGSSPTTITYAIFVDNINNYWNNDMIQILNGTGGSQSSGSQTASHNTYGIIPIMFLDLADIECDKPDSATINKYEDVASHVTYNNFFYISKGAESFKEFDRNKVMEIIQQAKNRAR